MTHELARLEAFGTEPPAAAVAAGAVSARVPAAKILRPPPGKDFWVFGYGSLMWHPGFPHLEVRPAHLYGYHRHFCVFSHHYRGTKKRPGLVLGLDRGGSCHGLAYRVPAAESEEVVEYLHEREMATYAYDPRWLHLRTRAGPVTAAAFVVDRGHKQYAGRLPLDQVAGMIAQGTGDRGSCLQYLENTVRHLEALGLSDPTLKRLLRLVLARREDAGQTHLEWPQEVQRSQPS
jgi:cation transport protein ChaC